METNPDMAATREELLAAAAKAKASPNMVSVPAPELGPGKMILVRQLDGLAGEALERSHFEKDPNGVLRFQPSGQVVRWAVACCCDAHGNRLFAAGDERRCATFRSRCWTGCSLRPGSSTSLTLRPSQKTDQPPAAPSGDVGGGAASPAGR